MMTSDRPHTHRATPITPATRDEIDSYSEGVREEMRLHDRQPRPMPTLEHVHDFRDYHHPSGALLTRCVCGEVRI